MLLIDIIGLQPRVLGISSHDITNERGMCVTISVRNWTELILRERLWLFIDNFFGMPKVVPLP